MKRFRLTLIAAFAALLPMLMAPTGGFPVRPIFQAITVNNINLTPTDSGTITWSFQTATSNCSVSGTDATLKLHKLGKVVTVVILTSGNCTTAATISILTNNTPIPAAFRPTITQSCTPAVVNIAASPVPGYFCVNSTGNIVLNILSGTATVWAIGGTYTFSYTTD